MIKVVVNKIEENRIAHITVAGHAGYDNSGKDIVCSAVSAITIGLINSTEILLNVDLNPIEDSKNGGYMAWEVPKISDFYIDDRLQLLMKAMVESLLMIEQDYSSYINVKIETS